MQPKDEVLALWGRNIRARREFFNLSQAQLGEQLDPPVVQGTIARWEAGVMEPRRAYKAQLASSLQASVEMIFPLAAEAV